MIIYDDDDPWNQTPADNVEWLERFKRDVGLAVPNGPGLAEIITNSSWRYEHGGSGFSPPYVCPSKPMLEYAEDLRVQMDDRQFEVKAATATTFLKSMKERYQPPGRVFCGRELESGLNDFVKSSIAQGMFPSDDMLRARAREIMKMDYTSADDSNLLERFKALHGRGSMVQSQIQDSYPIMDEMLLAEFDKELERVNFKETGTFPPSALGLPDDSLMVPSAGSSFPTTPAAEMNAESNVSAGEDGLDAGIWMNQDYADLYRVHAATSSPLRRRASRALAAQNGFATPTVAPYVEMGGIEMPTVQKEKVSRLNGSGEVGMAEWERWSQLVGDGR